MGECRNCSQQYDGFEITLGKIIRFPSVLLEGRKGALPLPRFLFTELKEKKKLTSRVILFFEEWRDKGLNDSLGTALSLGMFLGVFEENYVVEG